MNKLKEYLIRFWMLPQDILGMIVLTFFVIFYGKATTEKLKDCDIFLVGSKWFSGVSLGRTILLNKIYKNYTKEYETTILHEYGHYKQGRILGPFYLLVVGLPSITMNIMSSILYKMGKPKMYENYYKRWPENWADKLSGVVR